MYVCAWCDRDIDNVSATVQGVPATTWGMCPDCLSSRLDSLRAAPHRPQHNPLDAVDLDVTKPKALMRLDEEA